MKNLKLINGRVITANSIIDNGCVCLKNGKIECVGSDCTNDGEYEVIDVNGQFISPGFVEIHSHGAGGHDFMDGTVEAYLGAANTMVKHGTTSLLPTTVASSIEDMQASFNAYDKACLLNDKGTKFIGIHLEGPYFSMEQRGAQDPKYIKNPTKAEYEKILSITDKIKRWSIAPELDGALQLGDDLMNLGILPSIAHTDAIFEEILEAYNHGYRLMTHFYSGMSMVKRVHGMRYAGAVEAGYFLDDMVVEIIADGVHLPQSLLKLILKLKGPDKMIVCTDSMRAAGMPEGEYILGSLKSGNIAIVEDGVAKLPDRSAFAGSVATSDRLIRTMINIAGASLTDAIKMATINPAKMIKMDQTIGSLEAGKEADVIVFDDNIQVSQTIIGGKVIYMA